MTRPPLEFPGPAPFAERLADAWARARATGRLDEAEYDALLVATDFDAEGFERLRADAQREGVELPEADPEAAATESRPERAEPERDLLDLYLREIGRISLLEHRELLALARRSRAGDDGARRRIILANLRLVVHVARRYRYRGLPLLDLIEEGNLGLIAAVDRFAPERELRFSTYAAIWIRQAILLALAEQSRAVRIPVQMFQQVNRYIRAERALRARGGAEPDLDAIAHELGISTARAGRLRGLIASLRSLDDAAGLDTLEQLSAAEALEPPPSIEELVELQLQHAKIGRLLRSLGGREEQILRIRYGFLDGIARTLAQTGERFGITRERVRQIESRALRRLREALELEVDELRPAGAPAAPAPWRPQPGAPERRAR